MEKGLSLLLSVPWTTVQKNGGIGPIIQGKIVGFDSYLSSKNIIIKQSRLKFVYRTSFGKRCNPFFNSYFMVRVTEMDYS